MRRSACLVTVMSLLVQAGLLFGQNTMAVGDKIVSDFSNGGSRAELLLRCKAALAEGSAGAYKKEFESLVAALEREPAPPEGYIKPAAQRSAEEAIRAEIYDLNGNWMLSPTRTDWVAPATRLVARGPAVIDALIQTLDDATPCREIGDEIGPSLAVLRRREDLALACIERIAGCTFYRRTQGRGTQFHNDPQRASVVANIRAWWKLAKGKSQAEGLRVQLDLWRSNTTLSYSGSVIEAALLAVIIDVEGPSEQLMASLRQMLADDKSGLNSFIAEIMMSVDPQPLLRGTFDRFWKNQSREGDYSWLLRYGDKKIYQEIGRRALATGQLDPGPWGGGDQAKRAAESGRNWAIPFLAAILRRTEMTGSRSWGNVPSQRFSAADEAAEPFQTLTGKDFGYRKEAAEADRLAAIQRAQQWWETEGPAAVADKVNEDRPAASEGTDLLATDEQLAAMARDIGSRDAGVAHAVIARMSKSYSWVVQKALLSRLMVDDTPAMRVQMIEKIAKPTLWQAPALADVFEHDQDPAVRQAAGIALAAAMKNDPAGWRYALEPRANVLTKVRHVADSATTSPALRALAAHLLINENSFEDVVRLEKLASAFPGDAVFDRYLKKLEQQRNRTPQSPRR